MRRFALPLAALLFLGMAAFWMWNRDSAARAIRTNQFSAATEGPTKVRTGRLPCNPNVRCAQPTPAPKAPPPSDSIAAPESVKLPEFVDDDPVVAVQPLWTPDMGPAILRGGARVEFELTDAKGQALEAGTEIGCELWRKVGKHSLREGVRLNATRSAIICDSYDEAGLEPGDYELSVSCGPYGSIKREFRVSRGEARKERLETPNWRRIITLNFTDKEGRSLPYLVARPRYTAPGITTVAGVRPSQPANVLRAPPEPARDGYGVGLGGSSSSQRARPAAPGAIRFPTHDGKWYVRVFAGGRGSIRCDLGETLFGVGALDVSGDFTEPVWDNYVMACEVPPDFLALMEQRELVGDDDPGHRSLLLPPAPATESDLYDVSLLPAGYQRLIVAVSAPCPVTPRFFVELNVSQPKDKNPGPRQVKANYHERSGRWWLDLAPDSGVELDFVSPQLLHPGRTPREVVRLGDNRIVEVSRSIDAALLSVTCPSPTLAALGARLEAVCNGVGSPDGAAPWQPDGTLRLYVLRGQDNFETAGLATSVTLRNGYERRASGTLSVTLNATQKRDLALGGTTVRAKGEGLVLRAVGPSLEGLPWVEASLLEFDQDVASKRLRKHWKGSAAEMDECYSLLRKLAAKDVEPDHPDVIRLDELMLKLEDPDSRDWLRREGAWYNTHARIYSSDHGYLCLDRALDPKKRYVLYLWSNSRNELMPDKRIDFMAAEGITDLGAVMLPPYSE